MVSLRANSIKLDRIMTNLSVRKSAFGNPQFAIEPAAKKIRELMFGKYTKEQLEAAALAAA